MPEDVKMKAESKDAAGTKDKPKEEEEENIPPPMPPLEAAARRLERLLGGGLQDKDKTLHTYSNPGKVVRRWLGTASGASGGATLEEISSAAAKLFDPKGPCETGRSLLGAEEAPAAMEVDTPAAATSDDAKDKKGASSSKEPGFLSSAAYREVEGWLISLKVRLLLNDKKASEAFELSQQGIGILMGHINTAALKITAVSSVSASSLYPLLARMFRYRSLAAEELNDASINAGLRQDMAKAHNMACLRRDVDCQSTLLNLMLRDLLSNAQGKEVNLILLLANTHILWVRPSFGCQFSSHKFLFHFFFSSI